MDQVTGDDPAGGTMIHKSDRVATILDRDARLVEAFVGISPIFERLRNPLMRKTMARLTTVEQAARMAGIDPEALTEQLNDALSGRSVSADTSPIDSQVLSRLPVQASSSHTRPPALDLIPSEEIVELDVRDDLRNGREPFARIMAARREIPPGGALCLRATFDPVPLYAVMAKQGFDHWTQELAADDWQVWFYSKQKGSADVAGTSLPTLKATQTGDSPGVSSTGGEAPREESILVLDVRGMEPPEPMVRTLAALEGLSREQTLLQINERIPQFLLPKLEELGFTYEIREQEDTLVRIFIRHRTNV